ncbi:hypothetical protein [Mesorhizobium sp. M0771]|uniref:hypothetical protein n=1 Tax=Mesorhizobium sp. M0771 TaxID=2956997 RepID=UPI00333C8903
MPQFFLTSLKNPKIDRSMEMDLMPRVGEHIFLTVEGERHFVEVMAVVHYPSSGDMPSLYVEESILDDLMRARRAFRNSGKHPDDDR